MRLSTGIRNLEAAVKRLEAAAGKGQRRCAFCRLALRHSWPDPERPKARPEEVVKARCEFCRSEYTVSIAHVPEGQRDAYRLHYSFTLEDQYTDPRAHALALWLRSRPGKEERREKLARARVKNKNNPKARARAALLEEVTRLYERKHRRLKAKYGDPFPEHLRLIESARDECSRKRTNGVYAEGLFELQREETAHHICAELEKIIWGQARVETSAAIERLAHEIPELIRAAKEREERRAEDARVNNLEFLNKNRASVGLPRLPDDYGKR